MPFFKITLKNSKIKKFPQIRSPWDCLNKNQMTFVKGDPMVFFNVLKPFTLNSEKKTSLLIIQAAIDWFCRLNASASNS